MGAYENPAIIRDNSGQVYGQAIANFGKAIGDGFKMAAANRQNLAKQARKEAERIQGVQFRVEQNQYQEKNRNYETLRESGVPLLNQFDRQSGVYMMGRGERGDKDYLMGAVEAQTLLATSSGLSVKDRQGLNNIVERSKLYQKNMISNAGKVIAELELYKSIPASDWEQNFTFQGANAYEKQSTQFAAAILSNQKIPGAIRTSKELAPVSADGTNILTTKVVMDPSNVNLGGKFNDEKKYPRDKDGNIEFTWSKDLNGDINLINEIDAAPESAKIAQEMGIIDDKGNIEKNMYVGGTGIRADDSSIRGLSNYTNIITEKIVNVGSWNQLVNNDLKSKAAGILKSYDTDHLQAFMAQRMKLSNNFDLNKFRGVDITNTEEGGKVMDDYVSKMIAQKKAGYPAGTKWTGTATQQEDFLKNELFENFLEQRTSGLKQRPAQSFDKKPGGGFQDWVVMDPTTGEPTVYFQGTEQVTKKGNDNNNKTNPQNIALNFVQEVLTNPKEVISRVTGNTTGVYNKDTRTFSFKGEKKDPITGEVEINKKDINGDGILNDPIIEDRKYRLGTAKGRKDFFAVVLPTLQQGALSGNSENAKAAQDFVQQVAGSSMKNFDMEYPEGPTVKDEALAQEKLILDDVKKASNLFSFNDNSKKLEAVKNNLIKYVDDNPQYKGKKLSDVLIAIAGLTETADSTINLMIQELKESEPPEKMEENI